MTGLGAAWVTVNKLQKCAQYRYTILSLKKTKNIGRGLKTWGIVEMDYILRTLREKNPTKLILGCTNGDGRKTI